MNEIVQYRVVNLTPHDIRVVSDRGEIVYPRSGQVARLQTVSRQLQIEGLPPVVETEIVGIEGLPEPQPGVVYLVSTPLLMAAARLGRLDVLAPDTGPESAVRDKNGQVVAVRRLQRFYTEVVVRKPTEE